MANDSSKTERALNIISNATAVVLAVQAEVANHPSIGWTVALMLLIGLAFGSLIANVMGVFKRSEKAVPSAPVVAPAKESPEVRITFPVSFGPISVDPVKVQGVCRFRPSGRWMLWTRRNVEYWPHGDLVFAPDGKSWTASAIVNVKSPGDAIILVARVSQDLDCLLDFYKAVGSRVGWQGIQMPQLPSGLRVADEISVRKNSGSP